MALLRSSIVDRFATLFLLIAASTQCNAVLGVGGLEAGAGGTSCAADCASLAGGKCQQGTCNSVTGKCVFDATPDGTACDDGAFCTTNDSCSKGVCVGGMANDCGMKPGLCQAVGCKEDPQGCSLIPGDEGTTCVSSNPCLMAPTICQQGICTGASKLCPGDQCNVGTCNATTGQCEKAPANQGKFCSDGAKLCTLTTCNNGQCAGTTAKDCSAFNNSCNIGTCNPINGQCATTPVMMGKSCPEAKNQCNDGECNATGQCLGKPTNEGSSCTMNACFTDQKCSAGQCQAGAPVVPTVYFEDTFANNLAGWKLDSEWQIGSAMTSSGQTVGSPDPSLDHTATADNGVAGVMIGGNASKTTHGYYYLTSPPFDSSNANDKVWLVFWRLLNSDHSFYMANRIEVWDGTKWVVVWTSTNYVLDAAWKFQSLDVTSYKNAAMQVRFGFNIAQVQQTCSGWNIDDVRVASHPCPQN